jgi:hypothetical protein
MVEEFFWVAYFLVVGSVAVWMIWLKVRPSGDLYIPAEYADERVLEEYTLNLAEATIVDDALEDKCWEDVLWGTPVDPALIELRDQVSQWVEENS